MVAIGDSRDQCSTVTVRCAFGWLTEQRTAFDGLGEVVACLEVGEDEGARAAHGGAVARHDCEGGDGHRGDVVRVDHK